MNQKEREAKIAEIKYELRKGIHTYTMCKCGRHGCRSGKCWECLLEEFY